MLAARVIAILDADGNVVVSYMYDAWGAPLWCTGELAETLGKVQPFRYRGYVFDEETGMYYLQERYYSYDLIRFINSDIIIRCNGFAYANENPCNFIDPNGTMPVSILNYLCWLYGNNYIGDAEISIAVIMGNGGNIYNAFHEIAQLNVAKQLYMRGFTPTLEFAIDGEGEADISAGGMLWEVKAIGRSGAMQLKRYVDASGMNYGEPLAKIDDIPIVGNIKMGIISNPIEPGVINYYFYIKNDEKEELVKSRDVREKVHKAKTAAMAIVGATMLLTFAEDILTFGGGVADDLESLLAALMLARPAFGF